jgi:nucleoside-diphosphate-sugar epimerase
VGGAKIGGGSRFDQRRAGDHQRITGRTLDIRREATQKGDMRDTFADTSRAKTELGFVPSTSLEQGLQAEAEWLSTLLGTPLR